MIASEYYAPVCNVRPLLERAAQTEILLADTVESLQRFLLALESTGPKDCTPDNFAHVIAYVRIRIRRLQEVL